MNNDLISREALKTNIDKFIGYLDEDMIYRIKVVIDNAPTVESEDNAIQYTKGYQDGFLEGKKLAERPQGEGGKWIIAEVQCPNCFKYFEVDYYSAEELNKCPNCGADMRGKEE